jgi:hypothetical protein
MRENVTCFGETNRKWRKKKRGVGEKEGDISWAKSLFHDLSMAHYSSLGKTDGKRKKRILICFLLFFLETKQRQNITLNCRVEFCVSVLLVLVWLC